MLLAKLQQILKPSELVVLDELLRQSPADPVNDLLIEILFEPQIGVESPRILSSLECAVVAGCLVDLDISAQYVLQVLDYVSSETLHRRPLEQRIVILNYLLENQCWDMLAQYVDAAAMPSNWFGGYAQQRQRFVQKQIDDARFLLYKNVNITLLVRRLKALDPDSPQVRLLEGEFFMAENRHKRAQTIFMQLAVDKEVGKEACELLDFIHPELDLASTSEGAY